MADDVVLTDPWVDLRGGGPAEEAQRSRLRDEINAEVREGHDLHGLKFHVVGRSFASDDVLLRLSDAQWAIVHITWNCSERPPWPVTEFFGAAAAVERAIDLAG